MTDYADLCARLREEDQDDLPRKEAAAAIEALVAENERLARELSCRDALIKDHLGKIMHLENRIEEECARAEAAEARLATLDRLAATGTAESFLQCDDAIKKFVFADWIEESARKKKAERQRNEALGALGALLRCPEIADCDPRDKDEETQSAERAARAMIQNL